MCNKAICLLPRGNVLHILASLRDAPRLALFYFSGFFSELLRRSPRGHMHVTVHCRRSFVGHKRFLSDGPIWSFVCFAPNRQLQCWRERGESLTMKVSNQCSSCSILCAATGSSRRKWPSSFKALIWECFSQRRLAPSRSILLLSEHKVTIIHQQMALFKYDSVLNCNGSLQSTSLIGINTSALYEWFTEERQMCSVLLPFTDCGAAAACEVFTAEIWTFAASSNPRRLFFWQVKRTSLTSAHVLFLVCLL